MTGSPDDRFPRALHVLDEHMRKNDSLAPRVTSTSAYHLPGAPEGPYQYGRWTNPGWDHLEAVLSVLEDARTAIFPSGMAAIAAALMPHARPGDRVLLPSDGYAATRVLAEKYLVPNGVAIDYCATLDYTKRDFAGYKIVFIETPSNPGLNICDLADVAMRAKAAGAITIADNTTMTPLGQRPLDHGVDIVVASDTKALNGHSDMLFGHIAMRDTGLLEAALDWRKLVGAIPGPFETWAVARGIETLELRLERMCATAQLVADRLREHPVIGSVIYPGFADHPGHDIAARQMLRFGSLVGVTFESAERAEAFLTNARFIRQATSFGGTHSSAERRARWGDEVPEGFVRLSVGCEPAEVLWADIAQALSTCSS